jgi:hypothetical protein
MALTRNEIRKRLSVFAKEHQGARNERSQAQTFWLRFYECFGIRAESATIYEQSVKKLGGAQGFIDSFIPGKLIVEHKSAGKDLDAAFDQASDYFLALKEAERPRYRRIGSRPQCSLHHRQAARSLAARQFQGARSGSVSHPLAVLFVCRRYRHFRRKRRVP